MSEAEAWKLAGFLFRILPWPMKGAVLMLAGGYLWFMFAVVLPAVLR